MMNLFKICPAFVIVGLLLASCNPGKATIGDLKKSVEDLTKKVVTHKVTVAAATAVIADANIKDICDEAKSLGEKVKELETAAKTEADDTLKTTATATANAGTTALTELKDAFAGSTDAAIKKQSCASLA